MVLPVRGALPLETVHFHASHQAQSVIQRRRRHQEFGPNGWRCFSRRISTYDERNRGGGGPVTLSWQQRPECDEKFSLDV